MMLGNHNFSKEGRTVRRSDDRTRGRADRHDRQWRPQAAAFVVAPNNLKSVAINAILVLHVGAIGRL